MLGNRNIQKIVLSLFVSFTLCTASLYAKPVGKDRASKASKAFLKVEKLREAKREEKLAKEGRKIAKSIQKHRIDNATPVYSENGDILAWVIELAPEGFVVTSANDKINPIISYSRVGSFPFVKSPHNILFDLIKNDMKLRQDAIVLEKDLLQEKSAKNIDSWNQLDAKNDDQVIQEYGDSPDQWPDGDDDGWLDTTWNQSGIYNDSCPPDPISSNQCITGCVATAMAQIVNYWKFPSSISFTDSDNYSSVKDPDGPDPEPERRIYIDLNPDGQNDGVETSEYEHNANMANINYNGNGNHPSNQTIADLMFACGASVRMNYSDSASGASHYRANLAYTGRFDYVLSELMNPASDSDFYTVLMDNMKNGQPAQLGIKKEGSTGGHSIVCDGYRSGGLYHLNFGWGSSSPNQISSAWYTLPTGMPSGYNVVNDSVLNISPIADPILPEVTNIDIQPQNSSTSPPAVTGTVTVTANVTDNVAVQSVALLVDGWIIDSMTNTSGDTYSVDWDTSYPGFGIRTVEVMATDTNGNWASSTYDVKVVAKSDITGDSRVNLADFAAFATKWLLTDCDDLNNWCGGADIDRSGSVGIDDLLIMAEHWLEGTQADSTGMTWVYINDLGVSGHEPFVGQMSKYETTNAQYCQFLNAALASGDIVIDGNYVKGADGSNNGIDFVGQDYYYLDGAGYTYNGATNGGAARINYIGGVFSVDSGFDNHPVTYISWYGSTAFCNYYSYRLPTEWEWQAVADHTVDDPYTYGCGTSINNSIANYYGSTHPYGTSVVGSFGDPAGYGYGMYDMAGNVWEWTSSITDITHNYFRYRGGSWANYAEHCVISYQGGNHNPPNFTSSSLGFRVCRDAQLNDGLVAYFPFDNNLLDLAGGHTGVWTGGNYIDGMMNQGYHFTGSNLIFANGTEDYFIVSDIPELTGLSELTLSTWFRGSKLHSHSEAILSIGDENTCVGLWIYDDSNYTYAGVSYDTTSERTPYVEGYIEDISIWHHYAMTAGNGKLKMYIDGALVSQVDLSVFPDLSTLSLYINKHLWVHAEEVVSSSRLEGDVDDIRMYSRVLSDSEIQSLYQNP